MTIFIILLIFIITVYIIIAGILNLYKISEIYYKKWDELNENEKLALQRLSWNSKSWDLAIDEDDTKYFQNYIN